MKATPVPAKPGLLRWTLLWERIRETTTRGCLSANSCIKPLLVSNPDTQTLQRLCLTRKKKQSSSSSSNVPRGTWWDVPAHCIFTEYLPYTSWLHKTGTQKSFISHSARASLEPPHCTCCAQHTWQDGLLQKVSFVERKTEGHPPFPPLRALPRLTPEGLIICAKIRQPALLIIFWRGGRTWEVLLGGGSSWRIWSTRKGFAF